MALGPHWHKSVPFFLMILPSFFSQNLSTSSSSASSHSFLPPRTAAEVLGGAFMTSSLTTSLPETVDEVVGAGGASLGGGAPRGV